MKRSLIIAALTAASLVAVPVATAADWHNNTLDQYASAVAGHATSVYCEDSWVEWYSFGANQGIFGFTNPRIPVVYVSPRQCETLQALAYHEDVGTYYAASAMLTLAHEGVHQRGVYDEGAADCTALPLLPGLATQFFGVPQTISEAYTKYIYKTKRIGKKLVRSVKTRVAYRSVANPWLTRLSSDALRWHRAKPAQYQGNC